VRRKLGDRRIRPRYDIVGDLWGTLETISSLALRNVGPGGGLIESQVPLPMESVHRLTFRCEGHEATVQMRVRHVKPIPSAEGNLSYLIGVEFLSIHPALAWELERWMTGPGGEVAAEA
jgi:hypothetical protein